MKMVASDFSTDQASLAFLDQGECVASMDWREERKGRATLLERLQSGLKQAGWDWSDVAVYAVGRGPGNYAGLRVSLTIAGMLAIPGGARVYALNSGVAMAMACFNEQDEDRVMVVGDARRGQLWMGLFLRGAPHPELAGGWRAGSADEMLREAGAGVLCISADWTGLRGNPQMAVWKRNRWVEHDMKPSATMLGRAVALRLAQGLPSEEPTPIYLHPAVAGIPPDCDSASSNKGMANI